MRATEKKTGQLALLPTLTAGNNALLNTLISGNKKKILTAFKQNSPRDIEMAVLKHIAASGGDLSLPLMLLSMDERAAKAYHKFAWGCIAMESSRPAFIQAIRKAPRGSIYQLLAALADHKDLPKLYLASIELRPGPADFFMALCQASEEGITLLQGIGAPSELPAARGKFEESPLGRAARAADRIAMRNMFLQMVRHEIDPGQWLSDHRKELPAWGFRAMKSVWTHMLYSHVIEREGLDPSKVSHSGEE